MNKSRKCVRTTFFDISRYFEISVFDISGVGSIHKFFPSKNSGKRGGVAKLYSNVCNVL